MRLAALCDIFVDEVHKISDRSAEDRTNNWHASSVSPPTAMASSRVLAMVESICMREANRHIDRQTERVISVDMNLDQHNAKPAGSYLRVRAWVERIADERVTFRASLRDELGPIGEARLVFAVVKRDAALHATGAARDSAGSRAEPTAGNARETLWIETGGLHM